jgi:type III secretory pathway component EscT
MPGLLDEVARTFDGAGIDLAALGLAWARVAPTVVLVPAFGLRALPVPVRAALGLALAASIYPALVPLAKTTSTLPWALVAIGEIVRGLPVALAAAVPLWAATMAGGIVDGLRGANDVVNTPVVEGRTGPLGVVFSILASSLFLATGGATRVVVAVAQRPLGAHPLLAAAHDLTAGIQLAVALVGPLLVASVVIEIAAALIARAASPAQIHALLAPLRSLGILAVAAIVFDRLGRVLTIAVGAAP